MSIDVLYEIPSYSDDVLWTKFVSAIKALNVAPNSGKISISALSNSWNIPPDADPSSSDISPLIAARLHLISSISCTFSGLAVSIARQPKQPFAELKLTFNQQNQQPNPIRFAPVLPQFLELLGAQDPSTRVAPLLATNSQQVFAALEGKLDQLANKAADLTSRFAEDYRKQTVANDSLLKKRLDEVNQSLDDGRAAIREKEEALAEREKKLDDRAAKHLRRELRNTLKERIKESVKDFSVTSETRNARWFVNTLLGIFVTALLAFGIRTAEDLSTVVTGDFHPSQLAVAVLHWLGFALLLSGTMFFWVRWQMQWAAKRAHEEMTLRRMELDVDRSNWIIEMALEWHAEGAGPLPTDLLSQLSTGLFTTDIKVETIPTPSEQLSALLTSGVRDLKLRVGDGEITLGPKELSRFQQ